MIGLLDKNIKTVVIIVFHMFKIAQKRWNMLSRDTRFKKTQTSKNEIYFIHRSNF